MTPIKGLTDRGLSFPEIGRIRKGAAKTANRPGKDLSYFRVVFDEAEVRAAEKFLDVYGEHPRAIRIVLPFNEIIRMWDANLEAYTAGRLVAKSDGEWYQYQVDAETGEMIVKNGINVKTGEPKPYVADEPAGYYISQKGKRTPIFCKANGRLKVIVPELERAAYMTLVTTSTYDIANISDQLRAFQTLNEGIIAGIPLIMRRRPQSISTPTGDGKRVRMMKHLISIEADPDWVKARIAATQFAALPAGWGPQDTPALPEPDTPIDYDDGELDEDEVINGEIIDHLDPQDDGPPEPDQEPMAESAPEQPTKQKKEGVKYPTKTSWDAWARIHDKALVLGIEPPKLDPDISMADFQKEFNSLVTKIASKEKQIPMEGV